MVMAGAKRHISESEVRISQNTAGMVTAAGVVGTMTAVGTFTVPDRTTFVIRPGDIASLFFATAAPVELAVTDLVRITHEDPNQITTEVLIEADYAVFREFQDRNLMFAFGKKTILLPDERLIVAVNGATLAAAAQTRISISSLRGAETIFPA